MPTLRLRSGHIPAKKFPFLSVLYQLHIITGSLKIFIMCWWDVHRPWLSKDDWVVWLAYNILGDVSAYWLFQDTVQTIFNIQAVARLRIDCTWYIVIHKILLCYHKSLLPLVAFHRCMINKRNCIHHFPERPMVYSYRLFLWRQVDIKEHARLSCNKVRIIKNLKNGSSTV